jgi:hypothetical protein
MRDIKILAVTDPIVLHQPLSDVKDTARAAGGIEGTGPVLVVEHTADNNLVTFRFKNANVKMAAAEDDFEIGDHKFRAGSIVIPNADRAKLEPMLVDLGLSAWAVASAPSVKTHDLDVPRIGYIHSWTRTQDEGWWRAALDTFGVPYTYFADQKLREGNLRAKYDVLIFPHVGGNAQSQVNGMPVTGSSPLPYKKTAEFPNLAYVDSSDDIRGGMGIEGLAELAKFVREGGTLITEGSTATIFPEYGITAGVTVEEPAQLFVRGSILRARFSDMKSPIAYGYDSADLPVYFNQSPVLNAGGGFGGGRGGGRGAEPGTNPNGGAGQNVTPNAVPLRIQPLEGAASAADIAPAGGRGGRGGGGGRGGPGGAAGAGPALFATAADDSRPRVVLQFSPNTADLLLSGTLGGGQFLTSHPAAIDTPLGKGHVVMFAIRPFWRWQTQGTYTLGFNAILNWNDLDAGKAAPAGRGTATQQANPAR